MTSARMRMCRPSVMITLSLAVASAPAFASGYLKLGDIKGESTQKGHIGEIEIQSWSWGETRTAGNIEQEWKVEEGESSARGDMTLKGSKINQNSPGADPDRPFVTGRIPNAAAEREMKESGEKGGTEDINIGVGELQEASPSMSMGKASPRLVEPSIKGRSLRSPAAKGSLTTVVPAGLCKSGARYTGADLETDRDVYRMSNVIVTSCSTVRGKGTYVPMEQISFNYSKIEVRGWNPEKK